MQGLPQIVAIVLAVLSGLVAAMMVIPMMLIFGGVFIVKSLAASQPSTAEQFGCRHCAGCQLHDLPVISRGQGRQE
jgi:hypothetical protein